jgi:iron complex outermembrane receptor protein
MSKFATALFCSVAIVAAGPAFAQTVSTPQATPPAATASNDGLDVIVVTAQRRSENLLTVPLSISATTGTKLAATGIKDIASLTFTTPGMAVSNGVGYTQLYIRGIGNGIFVGADPSVATFIDDVPRIYGSMVNNFVNVERVEVLKGAQGGLYGRNATGGVVNIITRQPSNKLAVEGRVSYGERNTFSGSAYVNLPISDTVAINASVTRQTHDPYVKNLAVKNPYQPSQFSRADPKGNPLPITPAQQQQAADFFNAGQQPDKGSNNQDFWAADTKLRINLAQNLKVTLEGDYARKHDSNGNGWYNPLPGVAQALLQNAFIPFVGGPALGYGFGELQVAYPGGLGSRNGKFTNYSSSNSRAWITDYGVSGKVELSLPGVDLTSISAFRWNRTYYQEDQAAVSVPVIVPLVINKKHNFYQELRAVSTGSGRFHFLGGATYLKDHFDGFTQLIYLNLIHLPANTNTDERTGYSVYGQVGYDITDQLTLTGSLRYVHEKNQAQFFTPIAVTAPPLIGKKLLPSATLSYKLENGTIYARYAKGFKTGGVNPVVAPSLLSPGPGSAFGPEQVDTYEIGYRAQLFDHKVAFTTAVFYNAYKGLQIQDTGTQAHPELIEAIINAGTARTYGVEANLDWRVARPLTLSASAGYLNAKYKQFSLTAAQAPFLSPFNRDGQQMPFSPKFQASMTAVLDQPLNANYHLTGSALYSYSSTMVFQSDAGVGTPVQRPYSLVNLRIGVKTSDDRYSASLFVNNLFNQDYSTFGGTTAALGNFLTYGDPRIIGGEVAVKF